MGAAERLLVERSLAVPRLHQLLVPVPVGCGRPVWVHAPGGDAPRLVQHEGCPTPGDDAALLELAATLATTPLPADRPLWRAVFVTGLSDGRLGLVLLLHHALADGVGGLAVLGHLVDPGPAPAVPTSPGVLPSRRRLTADALRSRIAGCSRLPRAWQAVLTSGATSGGLRPPRAAPCSLTAPTGPRRRFLVARADRERLRSAAHAHGGTINDALLCAVTGALRTLLQQRSEAVDTLRVAIMVAAHEPVRVAGSGNRVAPLVVGLRTDGEPAVRLARISAEVRSARGSAAGTSLIASMGPVFRWLAACGAYRSYLRRQRRFHTVVSNVAGPVGPLTYAGAPVTSIVPVSVGEAGNITVSFLALSYAGTLTVTVQADPECAADLSLLGADLQDELDVLTSGADR